MSAPSFIWLISFGSRMGIQPRILSAKFGDGYEQRQGGLLAPQS